MKRTPSDERIERIGQAAAALVAAIEGPDDGAAARVTEALTAAYSPSHDTKRTESAPERAYAPHVSSRERARQFGDASSPAAAYPALDGAPVGTPETMQARRREQHAAADDARAAGRMTPKQLRNQTRNARR